MEHDKRHLSRAIDLEEHMRVKKVRDTKQQQLREWRRQLGYMTSTWTDSEHTETERERSVREYVTGIIDHDEYARREEIRLTREATAAASGTAA